MSMSTGEKKKSVVPDYSIVLTQIKQRRGDICSRGQSVEIARGMLSKDQKKILFNELLRQRRAYLFFQETRCRAIEYNIKIKAKQNKD